MIGKTNLEPVVKRVETESKVSGVRLVIAVLLILFSLLSLIASFYRVDIEDMELVRGDGTALIASVRSPLKTFRRLRMHPIWYAITDYLSLKSKDVARIDEISRKVPSYIFPPRIVLSVKKPDGQYENRTSLVVLGDYGVFGVWLWWLDVLSGKRISKKLTSLLQDASGIRVFFFKNLVVAVKGDPSKYVSMLYRAEKVSPDSPKLRFETDWSYPAEIFLPFKGGYFHVSFSFASADRIKVKGDLPGFGWLPLKRTLFSASRVVPMVKDFAVFSLSFSSPSDVLRIVDLFTSADKFKSALDKLGFSPGDFLWIREAGVFRIEGWDVIFLHGSGAGTFYEMMKENFSRRIYLKLFSFRRGAFEASRISGSWFVKLLFPSVRGKSLYVVYGKDTIYISTMARLAHFLNEFISSGRTLSRSLQCSSGEFVGSFSRNWLLRYLPDSISVYFLRNVKFCGCRYGFEGEVGIDPSSLYGYFPGYPASLGFAPDGWKIKGDTFYYHVGSALYSFELTSPAPDMLLDAGDYIVNYCPENDCIVLSSGVYRLRLKKPMHFTLEKLFTGRIIDASCANGAVLVRTEKDLYFVRGRKHVKLPEEFVGSSTKLISSGGRYFVLTEGSIVTLNSSGEVVSSFTFSPEYRPVEKAFPAYPSGMFLIFKNRVAYWNGKDIRFVYEAPGPITSVVSDGKMLFLASAGRVYALRVGNHGFGVTFGTPRDVGFDCSQLILYKTESKIYLGCVGERRIKVLLSSKGEAFKTSMEISIPLGKAIFLDPDRDGNPDLGVVAEDEFHLFDLSI